MSRSRSSQETAEARLGTAPAPGRGATVARRAAAATGVLYLAAFIAFHGAVGVGTAIARLQDRHPDPPARIAIEHFREVDDRVWAGAQPDEAQYRELAAAGVKTVVDLRTGAADDPNEMDVAALHRLGMTYVALPIPDGHAPDRRTVRRFVEVVDRSGGRVFVHCGGGVGRSATVAAAYLDGQDRDVSVRDTLALGAVTLEQAWFLETGERNPVLRRISEGLDAPRRGWSRLRAVW